MGQHISVFSTCPVSSPSRGSPSRPGELGCLYMLFGFDFHHNFIPGPKSRALAPYGVRGESERLIARSLPAAVELRQMSTASTLANHPAHELGCVPHCGWTPASWNSFTLVCARTAARRSGGSSIIKPTLGTPVAKLPLSVSICKGVTSRVSIDCIGTQL